MVIALKVVLFVVSLALIAVVLMQSSKGEGLGSIGGGAHLFFSKNKPLEQLLDKVTLVSAVLFLVMCVALAIVK